MNVYKYAEHFGEFQLTNLVHSFHNFYTTNLNDIINLLK